MWLSGRWPSSRTRPSVSSLACALFLRLFLQYKNPGILQWVLITMEDAFQRRGHSCAHLVCPKRSKCQDRKHLQDTRAWRDTRAAVTQGDPGEPPLPPPAGPAGRSVCGVGTRKPVEPSGLPQPPATFPHLPAHARPFRALISAAPRGHSSPSLDKRRPDGQSRSRPLMDSPAPLGAKSCPMLRRVIGSRGRAAGLLSRVGVDLRAGAVASLESPRTPS